MVKRSVLGSALILALVMAVGVFAGLMVRDDSPEAAAQTGNQTLARQALNAVRSSVGLGSIGTSGGQLIHDIMLEKWITLFQNIEAYNDYKRTCVPNLAPAGDATEIPARPFYAFSERNTNPNIPAPEAQTARNPNDPPNATTPTGQQCLGQ